MPSASDNERDQPPPVREPPEERLRKNVLQANPVQLSVPPVPMSALTTWSIYPGMWRSATAAQIEKVPSSVVCAVSVPGAKLRRLPVNARGRRLGTVHRCSSPECICGTTLACGEDPSISMIPLVAPRAANDEARKRWPGPPERKPLSCTLHEFSDCWSNALD